VLGALLAKFKGVLLLLPKLKLLTTAGSMLVSIGAYALIWGWAFGVGFVALLFVHELGHYLQMRREGVKANWMVFIPFLGAAVGARSLGDNALAEARIGLAGPIVGTLGAAALLPVHAATGNELFLALAFTGFFLNLFNLVPIGPLDGGRAMAALSPPMWFVGLGIMALLAFTFPNPLVFLILVLGAFDTYQRWRTRKQHATYYAVRPAHRLAVGVVYLGLIVALVAGMDATHLVRTFAHAQAA
jgi:Zn-dependent protease